VTSRSCVRSGFLALALLTLGLQDVVTAADKPKARKKAAPTVATAPPAADVPAKVDDAVKVGEDAPKKEDEAKKDEESAPKVDFSGTWNWTFQAPNGFVYEPTLRIKQKGSKLAGMIYGKRGGSFPVRDVRLTKDSKVAFTLDREFYGFPMEVKFIGKLEGDSIAGKMGVQVNGDKKNIRVFDWTAHRARDDGRRPGDPAPAAAMLPRL